MNSSPFWLRTPRSGEGVTSHLVMRVLWPCLIPPKRRSFHYGLDPYHPMRGALSHCDPLNRPRGVPICPRGKGPPWSATDPHLTTPHTPPPRWWRQSVMGSWGPWQAPRARDPPGRRRGGHTRPPRRSRTGRRRTARRWLAPPMPRAAMGRAGDGRQNVYGNDPWAVSRY